MSTTLTERTRKAVRKTLESVSNFVTSIESLLLTIGLSVLLQVVRNVTIDPTKITPLGVFITFVLAYIATLLLASGAYFIRSLWLAPVGVALIVVDYYFFFEFLSRFGAILLSFVP